MASSPRGTGGGEGCPCLLLPSVAGVQGSLSFSLGEHVYSRAFSPSLRNEGQDSGTPAQPGSCRNRVLGVGHSLGQMSSGCSQTAQSYKLLCGPRWGQGQLLLEGLRGNRYVKCPLE